MTAALLVVTVGLVALLRYEGLDRTKLLAARVCSKALAAYAKAEALRRRRLVRRLADRADRRARRDEARFQRSEAWERWASTWSLECAAWLETQARLAAPPPPVQPWDGVETFGPSADQNREGVE